MPKCVDLTKDTKWQCFISFNAGFGFVIFEIMEINENLWNYGSQWMQNWELWKFIKSQLHLTGSGMCNWDPPRLKFKTNSAASSLNTKAQNVTSKCALNKDPRASLSIFHRIERKMSNFPPTWTENIHESPIFRGNVFSRHSLLESR